MHRFLKLVLFVFLLGICLLGCRSLTPKTQHNFEYLQMEHLGEDQIDMRVSPGSSRAWLRIMVASCDHEPINKQLDIQVSDESAETFDDFYNAFNGQIPLTEPAESGFKSDRYWLRLQFIQGNHSTDITNILLQERFKTLEKLVRERLKLQR